MRQVIILLSIIGVYMQLDLPPPSPCKNVYSYEMDSGELKGLVTLTNPHRYPREPLSLKLIFSFNKLIGESQLPVMRFKTNTEYLSYYDPGGGPEEEINWIHVNFVAGQPLPTLLSLTVNGEEFCGPQPDPPGRHLRAIVGLNMTQGPSGTLQFHNFSSSEVPHFYQVIKPSEKPGSNHDVEGNKPSEKPGSNNNSQGNRTSWKPGSYHDFEVDFSNCGVPGELPSPLVVHGAEVQRIDWPWQAAIFKKEMNKLSFSFRCGGTLVTRRHIVTAAHCVVDQTPVSLSILLGKQNLGTLYEEGQQGAQVKRIIVHPDFDSNYHNDISLIMLNTPVYISSYVKPACLWDNLPIGIGFVEGRDALVPGWGKDETGNLSESLKVAGVRIVSQEDCLRSDTNGFYLRFTNKNKTLCAGFRNGTGPCSGDSGGGLFLNLENSQQRRNTWFLRGIVSISKSDDIGGCDVNSYTVFTDVAMFVDWLKGHIHQSR